MTATVLRQGTQITDPVEGQGEYVDEQDPISGDIIRVWHPAEVDDPTTPQDETITGGDIPCMARGIVEGGIRVAGTTERFGSEYESVDFVRLHFPAGYVISKRDRITNIRDALSGQIFWLEEEITPDDTGHYKPTVFNVNGVTPLFDAFGQHIENMALLERAEFE